MSTNAGMEWKWKWGVGAGDACLRSVRLGTRDKGRREPVNQFLIPRGYCHVIGSILCLYRISLWGVCAVRRLADTVTPCEKPHPRIPTSFCRSGPDVFPISRRLHQHHKPFVTHPLLFSLPLPYSPPSLPSPLHTLATPHHTPCPRPTSTSTCQTSQTPWRTWRRLSGPSRAPLGLPRPRRRRRA